MGPRGGRRCDRPTPALNDVGSPFRSQRCGHTRPSAVDSNFSDTSFLGHLGSGIAGAGGSTESCGLRLSGHVSRVGPAGIDPPSDPESADQPSSCHRVGSGYHPVCDAIVHPISGLRCGHPNINPAGLHPIRRPGLNYSQSHYVRCDNPDGTSGMSSAYTLNRPIPAQTDRGRRRLRRAPRRRRCGRSLPSRSSEIDAYLRSVDALLVETVAELIAIWADLSDDGPPGILGESDLPQLIARSINGGKRFRPVMSYLGWLAAGGEERGSGHGDVVQIGAALEMLQLFVLVHDDVMDESASRRGRPTVHIHAKNDARGAATVSAVRNVSARASPYWSATWRTPRPATWSPICRRRCAGSGASWSLNWSPGNAGIWREVPPVEGISPSPDRSPECKSGRYTVQRPLELGAAAAGADPAVSGSLHDLRPRHRRSLRPAR